MLNLENKEPIYFTREEELSVLDPNVKDRIKAKKEKDPIKALDHLKDGFEFKINAGVSAIYIGAEGFGSERIPKVLNIDGHEIHTAGGCIIRKLESKIVHDVDYNIKVNDNIDNSFNIDSLQ